MTSWKPPELPGAIRITRDDAFDAHVDDMLKRQMSLRGELGITRDVARKWYYRNWFVFMVAGTVAAFAAWAIIEPYFNDTCYLQGTVEEVSWGGETREIAIGDGRFALRSPAIGKVRVLGEWIWLLKDNKVLLKDGDKRSVLESDVEVGRRLGLYAEYHGGPGASLALGRMLVLDPVGPDTEMSLDRQEAQSDSASYLLFALVAAFVGLAIGAADGAMCRLWRRALLGGLVGLLAGFIGGYISTRFANLVYSPLSELAMRQEGAAAGGFSAFGFFVQMMARGLGWCFAGMAMGLGQGIALRSSRLLLYGFIGGLVGGLIGGLLFDPIDLLILGTDKPSAHVSRLIGICVIGATVGGVIGIVELVARDAWLRMVQGPLTGKEFLLFRDIMNVGASPRSELYLFNDESVAEHHAVIRAVGENHEIEAFSEEYPTLVNGRPVDRTRLRDGDQIGIGNTVFVFQKRRG